jgi:DNA-directed RNA polymerase specialized sigma24 family protein
LAQVADAASNDVALQSLQTVIRELLSTLPDSQQKIILRRIDGCQVEEIAAEAGRSKRTVERVLQTFRQRLRDIIDEPSDDSTAPSV